MSPSRWIEKTVSSSSGPWPPNFRRFRKLLIVYTLNFSSTVSVERIIEMPHGFKELQGYISWHETSTSSTKPRDGENNKKFALPYLPSKKRRETECESQVSPASGPVQGSCWQWVATDDRFAFTIGSSNRNQSFPWRSR